MPIQGQIRKLDTSLSPDDLANSFNKRTSELTSLELDRDKLESYPLIGILNDTLVLFNDGENGQRVTILDSAYKVKTREDISKQVADALRGDRASTLETDIKAFEGQLRKQLRIDLMEQMGREISTTGERHTVVSLERILSTIPKDKLFKDPITTAEFYDKFLKAFFREFVISATVIYFSYLVKNGDINLNFEIFVYNLSKEKDPIAVIREISERIDLVKNVVFPHIQREIRVEAPRTRQKFEPTDLESSNTPRNPVLEGSALSVALALNLNNVFTLTEVNERKEQISKDFEMIYVTTDFANPAEMAMLAASAKAAGVKARYIFDQRAHKIGSYLERIVIPSIESSKRLTQYEIEEIKLIALGLRETNDISLEELKQRSGGQPLYEYFIDLKARFQLKGNTLADIYREINILMAKKLGIEAIEARDFLKEYKMTMGELGRIVDELSPLIGDRIENLKEDLGRTLSKKEAEAKLKSLIGNETSWGRSNKVFLRKITEGENSQKSWDDIDIDLSDLPDIEMTLGGNGWHIYTLNRIRRGKSKIVLVDKNTVLGSNFMIPLSIYPDVIDIIAPVVRVIPLGNSSNTGDGLDISLYLKYQELMDIVTREFDNKDPDVIGGKNKIVVTFEEIPVYTNKGREMVAVIKVWKAPAKQGQLRNSIRTFYLHNK